MTTKDPATLSDSLREAEAAVVKAALRWHRNMQVAKLQAEEVDLETACKDLERARRAGRSVTEIEG